MSISSGTVRCHWFRIYGQDFDGVGPDQMGRWFVFFDGDLAERLGLIPAPTRAVVDDFGDLVKVSR